LLSKKEGLKTKIGTKIIKLKGRGKNFNF